jgi:hypothetical protein
MQELQVLNEFYSSYDYAQRLQLALVVFAVFGSYLHFVVRRLAPGWVALAAAAPICASNLFLPLVFSKNDKEMLSRGICVIAAPFLGNLKVWCCCCCFGVLLLWLYHACLLAAISSADRSAASRSWRPSFNRLMPPGVVVAGVWLVLQQGCFGWLLGMG